MINRTKTEGTSLKVNNQFSQSNKWHWANNLNYNVFSDPVIAKIKGRKCLINVSIKINKRK